MEHSNLVSSVALFNQYKLHLLTAANMIFYRIKKYKDPIHTKMEIL